MSKLPIIGREASVVINEYSVNITAKIDTGADSSSIWASHIHVDNDGYLHFMFFDEGSPYFTGEEISTNKFSARGIHNASGKRMVRYCIPLTITIHDKTITTLTNLCSRKSLTYPMLIGRNALHNNFLVDVSLNKDMIKEEYKLHTRICGPNMNKKLSRNPSEFHKTIYQGEAN